MKKQFRLAKFFFVLPFLISFIYFIILLLPFIFSKITPYSSLGFFSVIEENNPSSYFNFFTSELLKNEKVFGRVIASKNNLGVVLVRFFNFYKINSSSIIFRIRQEENNNWYYQQEYKVNQFQPNQYFTFGFPIIKDSKGKLFYFEIESLDGVTKNAVGISSISPQNAFVYQYTKKDFLKNPLLIFSFFDNKIEYAFRHVDLIGPLFSFLILNFIFYFLSIFFIKWKKNIPIYIQTLFNSLIKIIDFLENFVMFVITKILLSIRKIYFFSEGLILGLLKQRKYTLIVYIFIIFLTALIFRISYYINPVHFDDFIYSQLGGRGDYDLVLIHALRFAFLKNNLTYYWSFINDYAIMIRFFSVFFRFFGFLQGINFSIYFLIVISSFVCLLPVLILSGKGKTSFGGFLASLLLAVNPLSIWLSSARALDVLTSLFFSVFIILYMSALRKRTLLLLLLVGLAGFIDVFNRPFMIINDAPALIFFIFLFLIEKGYSVKSFFSQQFKYKNLIYALLPFIAFLICYFVWNVYFTSRFNEQWGFSPKNLVEVWNPINDKGHIFKDVPSNKLYNYFIFSNLTIEKILEFSNIPLIFLIGLIILIPFLIKDKIKYKFFGFSLILIIYVSFLYLYQRYLFSHRSLLNFSNPAIRYFLDFKNINFVLLLLVIEFILLQAFFFKKVFYKLGSIIFVYTMLIIYGLYTSFSDRYFIQIILIFFIFFGLTFDKLIDSLFQKKRIIEKLFIFFMLFGLVSFILTRVFAETQSLIVNYLSGLNEKKYLESAKTILPKDAIILVGMQRENPIMISKIIKRPILFNIKNPYPEFIPYGEKYFHLPISTNRYGTKYNFSDVSDSDLNMENIANNYQKFVKYNFFILDYGLYDWEKILTSSQSGHPFFKPGFFNLEKISIYGSSRSIYKLVLK